MEEFCSKSGVGKMIYKRAWGSAPFLHLEGQLPATNPETLKSSSPGSKLALLKTSLGCCYGTSFNLPWSLAWVRLGLKLPYYWFTVDNRVSFY